MDRKAIFTSYCTHTADRMVHEKAQMTRQEVHSQLIEALKQIRFDDECSVYQAAEWVSFVSEEYPTDMGEEYPRGTGYAAAMPGNNEGMNIRLFVDPVYGRQSTVTFVIKLFTSLLDAGRIAAEITQYLDNGRYSVDGDRNLITIQGPIKNATSLDGLHR